MNEYPDYHMTMSHQAINHAEPSRDAQVIYRALCVMRSNSLTFDCREWYQLLLPRTLFIWVFTKLWKTFL